MRGFGIYLASRSEEENQILVRKVESLAQEFPGLRFIGLHPQGLALSATDQMAVAVINVPEWSQTEAACLSELRREGYNGPVLVMAKANASRALKTLRVTDNVVYLEKPYEAKDLLGILRKMLHARAVAQRIHRRFDTEESAEIELFGRDDRFQTKVCNLSKGGAYLETGSPTPIKVGDVVRMKFDLRKVNRVYTVPARVIWTSRRGPNGIGGIGIEFIGAPDVSKTLQAA